MILITRYYFLVVKFLERLATVVPLLMLRLLLAWEFGESGYEKLTGTNWFSGVSFPFPFSLLPAEISWQVSIWLEIGGALLLILGLGTRFISLSLMVLTVVAISAVHWPESWHTLGELLKGYRIVDENGDGFGNYKLPLIYLVMFMPLLFSGAGKVSLDYWIRAK